MATTLYLVIGALIASYLIATALEWYEEGDIDDKSYFMYRYKTPFIFAFITLFWLPALLWVTAQKKGEK